jgi:ABC-type phosphate transport system substrate-binding protein
LRGLAPINENQSRKVVRWRFVLSLTVSWRIVCVVVAMLACGAVQAAARDIAVVANKGTAQTGLTLAELIKLCKGQTTKWPDGRLSTVVLRDPTAPEMKLVVEKIFASTPSAAKELIDTVNREHRSRPVIVLVKSDADVMQRVQSTPGAIGLADVYSITSGVEVIRVGGKLPLESGYVLHGN